jgi:hypothetical protein
MSLSHRLTSPFWNADRYARRVDAQHPGAGAGDPTARNGQSVAQVHVSTAAAGRGRVSHAAQG